MSDSNKNENSNSEEAGIFEWMVVFPFMLIPGYNIMFCALFIAFGGKNESKTNFYYAVIFFQIIWFFTKHLVFE